METKKVNFTQFMITTIAVYFLLSKYLKLSINIFNLVYIIPNLFKNNYFLF